MKVLVTGGTGYLGEHVVAALVEAGHAVSVLVRDPERVGGRLGKGVVLVPGDLGDRDPWFGCVEAAEALVHLGGTVRSWTRDRTIFDRINVDAALDLTDRATRAGVSRVVVAGSLFALGPSRSGETATEARVGGDRPPLSMANGYVRSKRRLVEQLWDRQREGHPVIVVHPTILIGPGRETAGNHTGSVIADLARGRLPGLIGDGEQVWNLVPVEAAARGLVRALERGAPGENYILGGENWTQRRFVERAAHHLGVRPPRRTLGRGLLLGLARTAEAISVLTRREPFLTTGEVRLYDAHWSFSSARAEEALGYLGGDLEATVKATADWIRRRSSGND